MTSRTAVCLLVINRIVELPGLAVESILRNSQSDIYVGYINHDDVKDLPIDSRITYLNIGKQTFSNFEPSPDSIYKDFSKKSFFILVQYKWTLLLRMLELDHEYIVYSDLDVIWVADAAKEIQNSFDQMKFSNVFIQNFTSSPFSPKLCMGFAGFRKTESVKDFLERASKVHSSELELNSHFGDDDVMTKLYIEDGLPISIQQLPQSTFPVGNLLNLYSSKLVFPGLTPPKPFIFHSNYVVGLRNKRLMSRLFLINMGISYSATKLDVRWRFLLFGIRLKLSVAKLRRKILPKL